MIIRWKITGTLTTRTPLLVGNPALDGEQNDFEITRGSDYIPGSSLKGVLRHWLTRHGSQARAVNTLFGSTQQDSAGPTALVVHNAYHDGEVRRETITRTAINRHTRTALDAHLFTLEPIAAGNQFNLTLELAAEAKNAELDDQLKLLLAALDGFNHDTSAIQLGSHTNLGWGCMQWQLTRIEKLEQDGLKQWLEQAARVPLPWQPIKSLPGYRKLTLDAPPTLSVTLQFAGPLQLCAPGIEYDLAISHQTLQSSQVKGALRSQSERILRTLNLAACTTETPCTDGTCLACRLYGSTHAAGKLQVSDFRLQGTPQWRQQTLIGIDRFTGGVANGATTSIVSLQAPRLQGKIHLKRTLSDAEQGLLQLTLRDLAEGDIPFGMGAARGFGHCTAQISPDYHTLTSQGVQALLATPHAGDAHD